MCWQMLIGGKWTATDSRRVLIDPATEEPFAEVVEGDTASAASAVLSARRAFDDGPWPRLSAQARGQILFAVALAIRADAAHLAALDAQSSGKPIVEAEFDIADAANCFEYFGGLATKITGTVNPVADADALNFTLREPVGVVAAIVPWNYPLLMAAWKLAPALAAGCTCVLKPAEQTPLSILSLARRFHDCGLPDGVVNIVTGAGNVVGSALVEHSGVDKIAFTGSTAIGKAIMRSAADTLKRVTLELGGKSPNIFFADTPLNVAVDGALFGAFLNQGEICSAGSRILVERTLYEPFLEAFVAKAKSIQPGMPLDRATRMGPLVNRTQYERVLGYIAEGRQNGTLLCGGTRPVRQPRGFFVEPTIFASVSPEARIVREEVFGPVAVVMPFADEAEAVHLANDTPFGLAAAVWTRDIFRMMRMVRNVRAGVVWGNHMQPTFVEAPWGGRKQSGFGRELGPSGMDPYLESKQVHLHGSDKPLAWY